jgi:hypothetical protein
MSYEINMSRARPYLYSLILLNEVDYVKEWHI